jgi:nucleotide-binding universal stress UspA family protein
LKKFLVATDLSSRAEKALERAVQVSEQHRGSLTILHILPGGEEKAARDRQVAAKIVEHLRRKMAALSRSDFTTVRVLHGTPFVEIIRQARAEAADLILVGAHGEDFIKDLLLGTTAEKIARKGDRSVLVVKKSPHRLPYRRVIAAIDFSDYSRRALEMALRLAPDAEFYALNVYASAEGTLKNAGISDAGIRRYRSQVAREARKRLETFLRVINRRGKSIKTVVWNGRPSRDISRAARSHGADLVVVGTAGRKGIPYILLGSVAEHVMREAPCDVLVVRTGPSRFKLP